MVSTKCVPALEEVGPDRARSKYPASAARSSSRQGLGHLLSALCPRVPHECLQPLSSGLGGCHPWPRGGGPGAWHPAPMATALLVGTGIAVVGRNLNLGGAQLPALSLLPRTWVSLPPHRSRAKSFLLIRNSGLRCAWPAGGQPDAVGTGAAPPPARTRVIPRPTCSFPVAPWLWAGNRAGPPSSQPGSAGPV
jgi:hypothetical protein